jgi:hypothetical protein
VIHWLIFGQQCFSAKGLKMGSGISICMGIS